MVWFNTDIKETFMLKPKSKLFISGGVKQSGNGTGIKKTPARPIKNVAFDFDGVETRHVTLEEIMKQPSMYEI